MIVALVLIIRNTSWWKWLLLFLAEATTVAIALALLNTFCTGAGDGGMIGMMLVMGHVVWFSILLVVTILFAIFTD